MIHIKNIPPRGIRKGGSLCQKIQKQTIRCRDHALTAPARPSSEMKKSIKRIEGQVRGVEGMLENDAYCTDILMQVSAITCALNSFNKALLANHMKTCVVDNIREGNEEVIDELVATLQKLMK